MSNIGLYSLVQTLSRAEKRYFKLFMKRYSSSNESSIFSQLFDYLVKAKAYDREEVLLKNTYIKPNQLNNIRKRLYNYILLSLRTYNSSTTKSAKVEIYQHMTNFEILVNKGLYLESWNMLLKAEKLAEYNEFFNLLKEILEHKRYLANTRIKLKRIKKEVLAIHEKQIRVSNILFYIEHFRKLYNDLYEIFKNEGRVLRDVSLVHDIKVELLSKKQLISEFDSSYQASYMFYYNLRFIYQFEANWKKANEYINIPIMKFHERKNFNLNSFVEYRRLYTANILSLINLNLCDDAREAINEIKEVPKLNDNNKEMELIVFEDTFFFELESYIKDFDFAKAVQIIENNSDRISLFESQLHNVNQQSKRYRIALSYFGYSDFESALDWINKILSLEELKYRRDILGSVQLLNLLIHFRLGNVRFVKNKVKSVTYYLKKIDRFLRPEELLLKVLLKVSGDEHSNRALFLGLQVDLEALFRTNELDFYFFCYFDIIKWIEREFS